MSKRPYSDVPADDREPEAAEVSVRKKSKKVKNTPAEAEVETQIKSSKKEKKEKKDKEGKKEKKEKKEKKKKPDHEISESATITEETIEDVSPVAEPEDTNMEGTPDETSEKAVRKAARKAEKARLKALKKTEKKDKKSGLDATDPVDVSSERSTPKEGLSTGVSTVASTGASSLTSPEPPVAGVSPSSLTYTEDSRLTALPQAQIDSFLEKNYITITDPLSNAPKFRPITDFSYLPITDKSQLAPFASFSAPTPIQSASWPSLFAGRDMIGVAETGSGKTLAFGVPCIKAIGTKYGNKKGTRVRAVVVSPTRELAMQIYEQLETLAVPAGLQAVCIYGGVPKDPQKAAVKKSSIVVATPGRLNDLVDEGAVDLSNVEYLVLDEADRMLDKGFEDAIRQIIGQTPTDRRQTLMFTATWPPSVQALASTFMKSPIRINVGENQTGDLRANNRITQKVEVIDPYAKEQRLLQILKQYTAGKLKNDRILVFCLYKKEATRIENFIRTRGFNVAGIHGDLGQAQRTASLDAFKKGKVSILVATDVAARGLDIPEVKLVVNVTFPLTVEDYVHRIGRTGRAGKTGEAITLFTEHDKGLTGALVNVLNGANQPVPEELMKFGTTVKKKGHEAYGAFYRDTGDMKKATKITFD